MAVSPSLYSQRKSGKSGMFKANPIARMFLFVLMFVAHMPTSAIAEPAIERLSQEFGAWEGDQTIRHLFVLNNAPCTDEKREELRAIFQNGMCKF
jgi:hypothetical protein